MIGALAFIVQWAIWAYIWIIFAAAIVSWMNPDPTHPAVKIIYRLTDPVFTRVRRLGVFFLGTR